MICKKCGSEVENGIFCPNCGARLEDLVAPSFESSSMKEGLGGKRAGKGSRPIALLVVIPFMLLTIGIIIFIFTLTIKMAKKQKAEGKAQDIYNDARKVILDCWIGKTHSSVTKEGSVYSVTITGLIDEGIINETPFEGADSDGGMTLTFNEASNSWTCTTSGTVDGYKIVYDGNFMKAQ